MRYFKHPLLILMTLLLLPISGWAGIAMPCAQQETMVLAHHVASMADDEDHEHEHQHMAQAHAADDGHHHADHHGGLSCNQCTHCVMCHAPATLFDALNLPVATIAATSLAASSYSPLVSYIPDFPDRPPRS